MSTELARLLAVHRNNIARKMSGMAKEEVIDALIQRNPFIKQQKIRDSLKRKKGLYKQSEVINRIGISKNTFKKWMVDGKITPIYLPWFTDKGRDMRRYLAVDVDQLVRDTYGRLPQNYDPW